MAELLMKSAIPSEGPIRTSSPALRNLGCANLVLRSIPAKTPAGQKTPHNAQEPLYALFRPRGRNATKDSLRSFPCRQHAALGNLREHLRLTMTTQTYQ